MRVAALLGFTIAVATATAASGQAPAKARNTPDDIVCKLSGSCGDAQPDSNQQIKVGDERAFSLARPNTIKVPTATAAPAARSVAVATPARARPRPAAAAPATSRGGIDMQIAFANGSAELTDQAKAEARAFAEAMRSPALASMKFSVDGHTNAVGNRDYNLELSKQRAKSVVDFLVAQGIEPTRIEPRGYGFDKARPGTAPTAPVNRRVEFSRAN
ncbi:OmpA family protein [Sandarakinorhabdus sp. DWP1-3-1]|uniref:OmpA family protein n=1 Tax=Sandarakinorhabdus sp. DWP1-3-1 TaxID=2804627 RepID=UPI003CFA2D38